MRQFSVRSRDVLMNAQCPHKWWSTLKSAVFGSSSDSSLPPLIGAGGGLVCESVGKADLLSAHFDGKVQGSSRSAIHWPSVSQSHYLCLQVTGGEAAPAGSRFLWLTHWECFLFFWRRQLSFWPLVLLWYFGGFIVWVAFLFAGEWLMSPQFQRVHLPPQHPIIDQFL